MTKKEKALQAEKEPLPPEKESGEQDRALLRAIQTVLGEVVMLMGNSRSHGYYFFRDAQWSVLPALALRQYKILHNSKGDTVGYISWACVNEAVCERLKEGAMKLRPGEWNSGKHVIVMDVVGPEQAAGKMLLALKKEVFPQQTVSILGQDKEGGTSVLREIQLPDNENEQKGKK